MPTVKLPKGVVVFVVTAVVLALAFVVYQSSIGGAIKRQLPVVGTEVFFTERGVMERYVSESPKLTRIAPVRVGSFEVLESAPSPISLQEKIVLATNLDTHETLLGILKNDGTVQTILSSLTLKTDLAVTDDGMAVFAEHVKPVATVTQPDVTDDSEVIGEGFATGPVDAGVSFNTKSYPQGSGRTLLYAVDLKSEHPSQLSLGPGSKPRAVGGGFILAITPEGISRINARTSDRHTLVSQRGEDGLGSGISVDGSLAALRAEGNEIVTLYKIVGDESTKVGMLYTPGQVFGIALVDEGHIFVRTALSDVTFYSGSKNTNEVTPPTARMKLLNVLP